MQSVTLQMTIVCTLSFGKNLNQLNKGGVLLPHFPTWFLLHNKTVSQEIPSIAHSSLLLVAQVHVNQHETLDA